MREREEELRTQVEEEMAKEVGVARRHRDRVGDAVGEGGDIIFTRSTRGEGPPVGSLAYQRWAADQVDKSLP